MESTLDARNGRPFSVIALEVLGVGLALVWLLWPWDQSPFGALGDFLIAVAVTLWVTRGRSKMGRLVYTGICATAAILMVLAFRGGYLPPSTPTFPIIVFAVQCALPVALLWWPTTSNWLEGPSIER